jgi:5-formyltetrahydrofolate cyclo-ligase
VGDLGRRRAQAIERRRALDPSERAQLSDAVVRRVVAADWFAPCRSIGLYLAAGGEMDPAGLGQHARQRGCSTWYPIATDGPMPFRRWDGDASVSVGPFGVSVPPPNDECSGFDLDVVIVPMVLFGPDGLRVGRGGGHYDRTFADRAGHVRPSLLCGLAYDFQEDDQLTAQPWDVPLDVVITPTRTIATRTIARPPAGATDSG